MRINGEKTLRASVRIGPDAVLTIAQAHRIRVLRLLDTGTRRGPASEARLLYEDLSPPPPDKNASPALAAFQARREPGSGRPTKKERRQTDTLLGR